MIAWLSGVRKGSGHRDSVCSLQRARRAEPPLVQALSSHSKTCLMESEGSV